MNYSKIHTPLRITFMKKNNYLREKKYLSS